MRYKILYKKNHSDNIIQWEIHCDKVSYWTEYGIVGGKIIVTKPTYVKCKNIGKKHETNIEEQILKEMEALTKYKIESEGYSENIEDVNIINDNLSPMLANKFKTYNNTYKFIQPKLDGVRCLINANGNYSRKLNKFNTISHIEEELKQLFEMCPTITFDGELYNDKLSDNFNKIISLVRKNKPSKSELSEIEDNIEYHIYDMFDKESPNILFHNRFEFLYHVIKNFKHIKLVQTEPIKSDEDINKWFNFFTSIGYEGAMVRGDEKYEHKRSNNLLKVKKFLDDEYEILDIVTGDGNRGDIAAKFILQDKTSPQTFKAAITGNFDYCKELLLNKNTLIGKSATIKFFCLTPKRIVKGVIKGGLPRFGTVQTIRDYE